MLKGFLFLLIGLFSSSCMAEFKTRALLIASSEAVLSSQISGKIIETRAELGQRFKKNATLIRFDCKVQEATLDKVNAELQAARITFKSHQKLRELGSISHLEFALADAEVKKAQAELDAISAKIKMCTIRAPFSGRVVERKVNAHESVSQGDELLDVIDDSQLLVTLFAPSTWLKWLEKDLEFTVTVSETGQKYKAKVDRIGSRVHPVSQTIAVRGVLIDAKDQLIAGMSGQAVFNKSSDTKTLDE